jgi:MSHA type pilus biogenesis protein MshL
MKISQWMAFSFLVSTFFLGGCALPDSPRVADTLAAPDFVGVTSEPEQIAQEAQDDAPLISDKFNQGTFSLALKNVDIQEALAILSKTSPVPIVAEGDVSGRVTINIKNKPLGDLLFTLLRPLGYRASIENGMIVVGSNKLITRSFVINYLKDKRTSSSVTNASISAGSSGSSSSSGGSTGNVSVTTSGGSDYWTEIIKGIESIAYGRDKSNSKNSKTNIVTNRLAGVIHVTAPAKTMGSISSYLSNIEREVKRQVLIQAHIVEVELNDEFSLGIDWNNIFNNLKGAVSVDMMPTLAAGAISNSFVLDIDTNNFDLILDTFKEQGGINMLSSPKISTLNNQKAVIKLTTKEVTWVNSTIVNANGDTLQTTTTPQIDEVGLFLDVTPNISAAGSITMQVHPSITEVKEVSESPDGNSSKPVITVREIDTVVNVNSGQTMVIGGLIADKVSTVKRGIPLLGDIPYLGWLFSSHHQVKKKTELVIFLTPYTLNNHTIESIRTEHENRIWGSDGINQYVDKLMQ